MGCLINTYDLVFAFVLGALIGSIAAYSIALGYVFKVARDARRNSEPEPPEETDDVSLKPIRVYNRWYNRD